MKVVIMRGIPGSGKSTWVRDNAANAVVCSADHWFVNSAGEYVFNPAELKQAHQSCKDKFLAALDDNCPLIVVDNTNTQKWEFEYYVQLAEQYGCAVDIVKVPHIEASVAAARNSHGVPLAAIQRMLDRWED